eukprot:m.478571 g.478571  ORF g.478571 m.478571 type:complete len:941 (+) comp21167_c0_seq1:135-2957(+)
MLTAATLHRVVSCDKQTCLEAARRRETHIHTCRFVLATHTHAHTQDNFTTAHPTSPQLNLTEYSAAQHRLQYRQRHTLRLFYKGYFFGCFRHTSTMSVIGIDLGFKTSLVAAPRGGGIEVLANEYSQRTTASVVAFAGKRRVLGEGGRQNMVMNFKNTIYGFKHLIGRQYKDADVQAELALRPVRHQEMPDGTVGFKIQYRDEQVVVSVLQVVSMLLVQLKANAEAAMGTKVTDCVVGVPYHFTDNQRHALLDACRIAGLNCLRLFNETAAVALTYGIYKQDLPAEGEAPRRVVFVDVGHSQLQISCCAYNKGKLSVLLSKTAMVGGRDLTRVIFDHLCEEIKEKKKLDVKSNARAKIRLETECDKLKHLMSANSTRIPLNVECLMEDTDVSSAMDRETFEGLAAPVLAKIEATVKEFVEALAALKEPVSIADIYAVEVVGGSVRVPAIKAILKSILQKELGTTLNSDEAVARGCALQGAIQSPTFRVRDFAVADRISYGIELNWPSESDPTDQEPQGTIFQANSKANVSKIISFSRAAAFDLVATYAEPSLVPGGEKLVGRFTVQDVVPSYDNKPQKVKVKVKLNEHGTFNVDSATLYEKLPPAEGEEAAAPASDDGPAPMEAEPAAPEGDAASPPDVEMKDAEPAAAGDAAAATEGKPAEDKPAEQPTKKKAKTTKTKALPIAVVKPGTRTESEVQALIEQENEFAANDRQEVEKGAAKNALEEYVYDIRDKLSTILEAYITEAQRETFGKELSATEDWLYEDGEDQPKSVYVQRLSELRKVGDPVAGRAQEADTRPAALEKLQRTVVRFEKFLSEYAAGNEKYNHLDATDVDKVKGWVNAKRTWLNEKSAAQSKLAKHDTPVLLTSELESAVTELEALCNPIVNKTKPPPPKEEPAAEPAAAPAGDGDQPMPDAEAAPAADADAPAADDAPAPMDLD